MLDARRPAIIFNVQYLPDLFYNIRPAMEHSSDLRPMPYWIASIIAGLLTMGGASLLFGSPAQAALEDGFIQDIVSLKLHALIAMTFTGLSLGLQIAPARWHKPGSARAARILAQILAAAVLFLGVLSLLNLGLAIENALDPFLHDRQLAAFALKGQTMPFLTAACFLLAGTSLVLLDWRTRNNRYPAEYCALVIVGIMGLALIGFLFNASQLTEFTLAPAVSRQAPLFLLILAIGILCSRPRHPLMSVLFSKAPGGRLLRNVLPATLVLLALLDLLTKWGARHGLYSHDMIASLTLLAGSGLLLTLFWRVALLLNLEHKGRVKGEARLATTNDLIRIVSDCTTEAIHVMDDNGCMIFANPAALKMFDRGLELVLGRTSSELFDDPAVAALIEANHQAVLRHGRPEAIEFSLHVGKQLRTFYLTSAPWQDEHGKGLGTVGIATDITERKHNEDARKAHEAQLEALVEARTAEVRELIGHLQTMREEEKRAIARELHDDLGSSLTALNMHLAILFQQIPADAKFTERTVQIKALLNSVTATTRRIQNGLRPDKLDIFGIKTAITEQAQDFENYTGVSCATSLPDEEVKYSTHVEISLFRMVQEALNNIAKHARATHVDIILDDDDESIYLTIRDNGIGISSGASSHKETHGLRGMRERAAYFGGRIKIESEGGTGTRIQVILPKSAKTDADTVDEGFRHTA